MFDDYENKNKDITKTKGFEVFLFSCLLVISITPGALFIASLIAGIIQTATN